MIGRPELAGQGQVLRHAAAIAEADGREITLIEGDARFASTLIARRFDVIVTSTGSIVWLSELVSWARSIRGLLEPGAVFLIRDDHPILGAMGFEPWDITDDYLSGGGSQTQDDSYSYTENSAGQIAHGLNYQWRHDLDEIVTALLRAGLRIERLAELPHMDWPAFSVPATRIAADPAELRRRRPSPDVTAALSRSGQCCRRHARQCQAVVDHVRLIGVSGRHRQLRPARPAMGCVNQVQQTLKPEYPPKPLGSVSDCALETTPQLPFAQADLSGQRPNRPIRLCSQHPDRSRDRPVEHGVGGCEIIGHQVC